MKNLNYYLLKIYRLSAGLLFLSIFLYILTGYGMTKGIVDFNFSRNLHLNILPLIVLISFVAHTSLGIRTTLMRWRIWNRMTFMLLVLFYIFIFFGFFYLEFFYKQPTTPTNLKIPTALKEKIFTKEELFRYNGKNNMPAYAAVDGVVYDLTILFVDGTHYQHLAGQELTEAFYSKHALEEILKYPSVGILK